MIKKSEMFQSSVAAKASALDKATAGQVDDKPILPFAYEPYGLC